MGKELAEAFPVARQLFEEVDDALNQHLTKLMFEGPEADLTLTENAQPALMAVSLALTRVLEVDGGRPVPALASLVAGHSLGEYSALAAAGSFSIAEAAKLLKLRGMAMQAAVPVGEGAMAALLGMALETAEQLVSDVADDGICAIANDNSPGQVVISGAAEVVQRAAELAKERGAKRAVMLAVSAPFHCSMMHPAADVMAEALAAINLRPPCVPLIANVTAADVTRPDQIRSLLVDQVTARVRWRESVEAMRERGVDTLVEIGPGKVLSGLTRRIDRDLGAKNVESPDDVETFLKGL